MKSRCLMLHDDIPMIARLGFPKTAERIANEIARLNDAIKSATQTDEPAALEGSANNEVVNK